MNSYIFRAAFDHDIKHVIFTSCTVMYPSSNKATSEKNFTGKIIDKYKGVGETKVYIEKLAEFYSMIGKQNIPLLDIQTFMGLMINLILKKVMSLVQLLQK